MVPLCPFVIPSLARPSPQPCGSRQSRQSDWICPISRPEWKRTLGRAPSAANHPRCVAPFHARAGKQRIRHDPRAPALLREFLAEISRTALFMGSSRHNKNIRDPLSMVALGSPVRNGNAVEFVDRRIDSQGVGGSPGEELDRRVEFDRARSVRV